jgi:hypothetical protein
MTKPKQLPPLQELKEILTICNTSPSNLRWLKPRTNRVKAGDPAGTLCKDGYYNVGLKDNSQKGYSYYKAHRIVYYLETGVDPGSLLVDHVNNMRALDNKIRLATKTQNAQNCNIPKKQNKTSKYKGVHWHKKQKKWVASIKVNKQRIHLGSFVTELEAGVAYNTAAAKFFGEFARLNLLSCEAGYVPFPGIALPQLQSAIKKK